MLIRGLRIYFLNGLTIEIWILFTDCKCLFFKHSIWNLVLYPGNFLLVILFTCFTCGSSNTVKLLKKIYVDSSELWVICNCTSLCQFIVPTFSYEPRPQREPGNEVVSRLVAYTLFALHGGGVYFNHPQLTCWMLTSFSLLPRIWNYATRVEYQTVLTLQFPRKNGVLETRR